MERRVRRKSHARCGAGENLEITSKDYLSLLLINFGAFFDGEGTDPYARIYNHRISIKSKLKKLTYKSAKWIEANIVQEGYKLILNSASGILDGDFDTNLRANNMAISMRVSGQLATFIIAAALCVKSSQEPEFYETREQVPQEDQTYIRDELTGFTHPNHKPNLVVVYRQTRVPSSNTDGIYVFDIDDDENKAIIDKELEKLLVSIEPEPVYLVSKDTNNRMEMEETEDGYRVVSAKGGSLTAWDGARIDKRLTHPALVDRVLTYYLQNDHIVDAPINKPLIRKAINDYIEDLRKKRDKENLESCYAERQFVLMASWVMRSTSGSIFVGSDNKVHPGTIRTWLTKDGVKLDRYGTRKGKISNAILSFAAQLFPESKLGNPDVLEHLSQLGILDEYFDNAISAGEAQTYAQQNVSAHTVCKMKVSNLSTTAKVNIDNRSIIKMDEADILDIYNSLDINEYVDMIACFAKQWHNILLPAAPARKKMR